MVEVISDRLRYKVKKERILYIESRRNGSIIHALHQTFPNRTSLQVFEEQLKEASFVRSHESYLLNLNYVKEIQKTKAVLINGEEVLISRRQHKSVTDGLKRVLEEAENLDFS